jgi:hypothetical protein
LSAGPVGRATVERVRSALASLAEAGVAVVAVAGERDRFDLLFDGWGPPPGVTLVGADERRSLTLARDGEPIVQVEVASGLDGVADVVARPAPPDLPLVAVVPLPPPRPGGPPTPSLERSAAVYWAFGGRGPAQAIPIPSGAWVVLPGEPQLRSFPPPRVGSAVVLVDSESAAGALTQPGPTTRIPGPRWLPAAAVELITIGVGLGDLHRLEQLEAHLAAVADRYVVGLPDRLVVFRAVLEGDGPLRRTLVDPEARRRLLRVLQGNGEERDDRWWSDLIVAPLPVPDAQRLMATTGAGAAIAAAAAKARAADPLAALTAAWADHAPRPVTGAPAAGAWSELVTHATSLALDLTRGDAPWR